MRGAGPWPVCVASVSLGVSRLGSGKAKCRLSLREAQRRPQPSGQQGSAACNRATGSGQRTPASCAAPTHRWQERAGPWHRRLAGRPRRWPHVSMPPLLLPCFQNCNVAAAAAERGAPGGRARRHSRAGVPLPQTLGAATAAVQLPQPAGVPPPARPPPTWCTDVWVLLVQAAYMTE